MKRSLAAVLAVIAVIAVAALGRELERGVAPASAQSCAAENGDVNADGARDVSDAVYLLGWLFGNGPRPEPFCPGPPAGLPETGQTTCYDSVGNVVDCSTGPCAGQDGFHDTGCPRTGRFLDNGDGTVTDSCTGLTWQQDTGNGGAPLDWCAALAYCESLDLADHDDWRLPNVRELQSLVDYESVDPTIDPVFGALSSVYWSSTTYATGPNSAWLVLFLDGEVSSFFKDADFYVRAVRGGA